MAVTHFLTIPLLPAVRSSDRALEVFLFLPNTQPTLPHTHPTHPSTASLRIWHSIDAYPTLSPLIRAFFPRIIPLVASLLSRLHPRNASEVLLQKVSHQEHEPEYARHKIARIARRKRYEGALRTPLLEYLEVVGSLRSCHCTQSEKCSEAGLCEIHSTNSVFVRHDCSDCTTEELFRGRYVPLARVLESRRFTAVTALDTIGEA